MRAALPTVWGDVSAADRGDRLRQRNPFSKGFPSIDTHKVAVRVPRLSASFLSIILFLAADFAGLADEFEFTAAVDADAQFFALVYLLFVVRREEFHKA